jgi:hypothetical protein
MGFNGSIFGQKNKPELATLQNTVYFKSQMNNKAGSVNHA